MIAKLTPPVVGNALLRPRLFRELDRERRRPLTWIVGPAGSGKTTLAASYLHTRHVPILWYRVDTSDADLAAFVYHLGLAARRFAGRKAVTLPLLTPEYQGSLAVFARRFIETLAGVLPRGAVLVLDDYHDVAVEAGLHDFIAAAVEALPETLRVLVVSRQPAPPAFARVRAAQQMATLDGAALALSSSETGGLARRLAGKAGCSGAMIETLCASTHGWAAGVVLAVARTRGAPVPGTLGPSQIEQATFDYFAAEVFRAMAPETQGALLRLALLPDATIRAARALTDCADVAPRLDALVVARTFTVRHEGVPARYTFHPLFRGFLLARLRQLSTPEHLRALQIRAADLLAQEGRAEPAADLLAQAEAWDALVALIRAHGQSLLDQGLHATVSAMIERVPPAARCGEPWVMYLLGAAQFPVDRDNGRAHLAEAYHGFRATHDLPGLVLAWALIVDGIAFAWVDFSHLDEWIDAAERDLLPRFDELPPGPVQTRFVTGMFHALMYRRPEDPSIAQWAQRLEAVIARMPDPSQRMLAAVNLVLYYHAWMGASTSAQRVVDLVCPKPHDPPLTSAGRIAWSFTWAIHLSHRNRIEEGVASLEAGRAEAARSGVRTWDFWLPMWAVYMCCSAADVSGARAYLAITQRMITPERPLEYIHPTGLLTWVRYLEGDFSQSEALARATLKVTEERSTVVQQLYTRGQVAEALLAQGKVEEALAQTRCSMQQAETLGSPLMIYQIGVVMAAALWQVGRPDEALALLRRLFALAREHDLVNFCFMRGAILGPAYARALEAGIEVETVQRLVREHRAILPRLAHYPDRWPWPLRIHTLGRFELVKDGTLLRFAGKAQRKPIELLQALVALGGCDVREERLTEILWPETDGDAAHSAFTTTLSRLRTLIGERTITVSNCCVSLDPTYCWVDTWALAALVEPRGRDDHGTEVPDRTARILALYQGPFLGADHEEAWAMPLHERLRSRFVRYLTSRAATLSQAGRWDEAIALYQKGLDADGLVEPLHQGLMRAYAAQGRRAEALAAFERCRTLLRATLGIDPGPDTEGLATAIRAGR